MLSGRISRYSALIDIEPLNSCERNKMDSLLITSPDTRRCSTHWMYANKFKTYFPEVILMDNPIINDYSGV